MGVGLTLSFTALLLTRFIAPEAVRGVLSWCVCVCRLNILGRVCGSRGSVCVCVCVCGDGVHVCQSGSGIPRMKLMFSGVYLHRFLSLRTLAVKVRGRGEVCKGRVEGGGGGYEGMVCSHEC